jgi:hypothetical protein
MRSSQGFQSPRLHGSTFAQHQVQAANAGLAAVYGKWPGDETEEQLMAALKELD